MRFARTITLAAVMTGLALAATVTPLATSTHWQLTWEEGGVTLTQPREGRQARLTNPRVTFWDDAYQPWTAEQANISPDERYALVQWADRVPKYTSSELDLVTLANFQVQKLPLSDLRGSRALPVWRADAGFLAASGGNTVRLWRLRDGVVTGQLLTIPKVDRTHLSGADQVQFVAGGTQLSVRYTIIQPNGYPDPARSLQARYAVPGGQLLSTRVVNTGP